jgi:hypothetical protein
MKTFKTFIEENRKAMLAALALTSAAMAAPPAQEMPQIDRTLQGLASAEHRGRLKGSVFEYDPSLYIRTGGADPRKPKSVSSAYGPFQFTKSTIEDLSKRHPKIFSGSENYVSKFVEQGKKMIQSPSDPKYGYKGSGDLSGEEYHQDYMDMSRAALSAMAKDIKVDLSKPLSPEDEKKLVTRFRGLPPEPAYAKAYEKGVNIPKPQKSTQQKPVEQKPVEQKPQTQIQPQTQQTKEPTSDYEVKSGDSLSKIAKQYNKTVDEIIKLNPDIKNPDRIKPGQKIKTK